MGEKIHGKLIRAARDLLGWNQSKLAEMANCSLATVMRIELDDGSHIEETRDRIIAVMEQSGVKFTPRTAVDGAGVKWASPSDQARLESVNPRRDQRTAPKKSNTKGPKSKGQE